MATPSDQQPHSLRVPAWFIAAWIGLQGSLQAAIELLPPGTAWTLSKIAYAGVLAVGGAVAMLSSGRKK